jgi:hypothetical protein
MTSALFAGEKMGRGHSRRKCPICAWYADMEQGCGLRPIIDSATEELSDTNVLRCTLYVDRSCCITEHKCGAGLGESSNDCIIVIDVKRTPHL